jgi:hypothetical protein
MMDNSTPVFWIWIAAVVLFAIAVTVAYYFARKGGSGSRNATAPRDDTWLPLLS